MVLEVGPRSSVLTSVPKLGWHRSCVRNLVSVEGPAVVTLRYMTGKVAVWSVREVRRHGKEFSGGFFDRRFISFGSIKIIISQCRITRAVTWI